MTETSDPGARPIRDTDGQGASPEPPRSTPADGSTRDASASSAATHAPAQQQPREVALDPTLDGHQKQGITGGTWIALILGTLILILLLIFILQNNVPADFAFLGLGFSLPLGVAMLFAAIAGVLIAALLGSVRLFKLSRRVRKLEKERETIKHALR